jgi:hypothetical protein
MKRKIIKDMEEKKMKVVRVCKNEYELENGDIFPIPFELDNDITIDEFQKLLDESKSMVLNHLKNIGKKNE